MLKKALGVSVDFLSSLNIHFNQLNSLNNLGIQKIAFYVSGALIIYKEAVKLLIPLG
jgi:hypothetical protein